MIVLNSNYSGIEIQTWKDGVPANADSTPTCTLWRNGLLTAVTVTVSAQGAGRYLANFTTLGAGNGWVVADHLVLRTVAVISGVSYPTISLDSLSHPPESVIVSSNLDKTGYTISQAFPSNFSSLSITGAGAITAGTIADKAGYSLSSTQSFNLTGNVSGSVGSVTSPVTVGTNNDKSGYSLSSAGVQAIWDALTSALATVGSIGKRIVDNLDAAVSSRSTYSGVDTSGTTTLLSRLTSTRATNLDNLDAAVSSRSTYSGSDTAGTTTLLSRLTSGRASNLDNLDVAVSTRSTYAGGDTAGTTTLLSRLSSTRSANLDNLDATVSSRLAASSYTTPPTANSISSAIWSTATSSLSGVGTVGKLLVDQLDASISSRSTYAGTDTSGTTTLLSRLTSSRATSLDNLDATVSSRLSFVSYVAPINLTANQVWEFETRSITDKNGFALSPENVATVVSEIDLNADEIASAVRTNLATELARIDVRVGSRTSKIFDLGA